MRFNLTISNTYKNAFDQVLNKLKAASEGSSNASHFLIVPDRFTLSAEKSIFEALNIKSTFNVEVITLSKLANKVLGKRLASKKVLSKQSAVMLTTKIILNHQNELMAFKKATKLTGFAESIFETITQLKSCNLTPEEFKNSYDGDNISLKLKMHDIALIYKEYESFLENNYIDSSSKLNLLLENLSSANFINSSHFYFALFDSFTPQQYAVIEKLVKEAKSVSVGLTSNTKQNNANVYSGNMYDNLIGIAKINGMNLADVITNSTENLSSEFNFIANNFYAYKKPQMELKTNKIQLFEAVSEEEEIEFVASKITEHLVLNNYRYKDINLAVANLEGYSSLIEKTFKKYDIPYYLDLSKNLTEHIFARFVLQSINCVKTNFLTNEVLSFSKNYFVGLNSAEQNVFEDFVLKYGIDNTKFLREFDYASGEQIQKEYEEVRGKLIHNLTNLKNHFANCNLTQDFVLVLKEYLANTYAQEKLEKLEEEYEKQGNIVEQKLTAQVWDKINKLLNELEEILGEEKLNLAEFYNLLEQGLNSITLSTIPISVDSVFVGDINNNNFNRSKLLFVVGAVEGAVPASKLDVGIILDSELNSINAKAKLEPSIKELNGKTKFNFFQLLLTASDKLIMSYPLTNKDGKEQRCSLAQKELQKLFYILVNGKRVPLPIYTLDDYLNAPAQDAQKALAYSFYYANKTSALTKLITQLKAVREGASYASFEATNALYNLLEDYYGKNYLNKLIDSFDYSNKVENLTNAHELFFNNERTKVSELESYFTCPFKHFIEYGLKLKEKEKAELRALDIGIILHALAEQFGEHLKQDKTFNNAELKQVAKKLIDNILAEPKYAFLANASENKNLIKSLKEEGERLVEALYYQNQNSDFKVNQTEYSFGIKENKDVLELQVKNKKITFAGVIDRVDYYGDYFRIIDYKTGKSDFSFKELFVGKKIQLFIYASVVKILTGKKLAGAFYFPIKNDFEDLDSKTNNPLYKLEGVYLNNLALVKAMDKTLSAANLKSNIINANLKLKNDDLELKSNNKMLVEEEFDAVGKYAIKLATKAIEEILDGNITPSPYSENEQASACAYCKFNGICKFSEAFNNEARKVIGKITVSSLKEAVDSE